MDFSNEQQLAFDKYLRGHNVFITGPGGTGKSALIKCIQQDAYRRLLNIQVCALTGCAAVLLECKAKTIHSWSKINLGKGSIETNVMKIMKNKIAKATWKDVDILVIDEVSMMSKKLFETLDAIGKAVRKSPKPFGGIQLIFSGDFYQLPPVGNKEEPDSDLFCFESPLWFSTFHKEDHIVLCKIFRQSDPTYQQILNQIREGRLKRRLNTLLLSLIHKEIPADCEVRPTKLFPKRHQVDCINNAEMNKLSGKEYEYEMKFLTDLEMTPSQKMVRMSFTKEHIEAEHLYLQHHLRCETKVKIKIGAQVMCIVNITLSNGDILCNGAQGVVIDISPDGFPVVKYKNGYKMTMGFHVWESETIPGIGVAQIPIILAWALTIHKAQGATLDIAEVDAGTDIFECGQTYVALSRVKSLEGLYLKSFDVSKVKTHSKVNDFYQKLREECEPEKKEGCI